MGTRMEIWMGKNVKKFLKKIVEMFKIRWYKLFKNVRNKWKIMFEKNGLKYPTMATRMKILAWVMGKWMEKKGKNCLKKMASNMRQWINVWKNGWEKISMARRIELWMIKNVCLGNADSLRSQVYEMQEGYGKYLKKVFTNYWKTKYGWEKLLKNDWKNCLIISTTPRCIQIWMGKIVKKCLK